MFKFLKDKLKGALDKITKRVEEESPEKVIEVEQTVEIKESVKVEVKEEKAPKVEKAKVEKPETSKKEKVIEKPKASKKIPEKIEVKQPEKPKETINIKPVVEVPKEEEKKHFFDFLKKKKESVEVPEEKKGFFQVIKEKVTTKIVSEKQFEELFWDLELILLENNVAVDVIEKIKKDLQHDLTTKPLRRDRLESEIKESLKKSIDGLLTFDSVDILKEIKEKKTKPFVIAFVGINGSGKTTSIAKFAYLLQQHKLKPVLSASDTFRAAAIQQLEEHGKNLQVKVIKHNYGSDPAAVAFDTIEYAKAHNLDVVLIDTAGRLHSNTNLVDEMKKIMRVSKPDLKIFVGEAITGNDCIEQAERFHQAITIDGIILAKADIDEKGGASLSVSYVTKKPIFFLGTGQNYKDLEVFNKEKILKQLGL